MKTNENLQKDVQDAIRWEPLLRTAEIGVTAQDGVITLSGTVDSYAKKSEAEDAAKKVVGVKAVVETIEIKFGILGKKTDNEIATEVLKALKEDWEVPDEKIKVKVEEGWITLEGELEWNYQREAAKTVIKNLAGVVGVSNRIDIKTSSHDTVEIAAIERALNRNWSIDEESIEVHVSGNKVTLNGVVDSVYQREEAGRIAWNAPGVWAVDNELVIDYYN